MKNTRQIQGRRTLRYDSFDAMLADLDAVLSQGEVKALGNWSAAQNIDHVALAIEFAYRGYPPGFQVPLALRLLGPVLRGRIMRKGIGPGIKPPASMGRFLMPPAEVTMDQALDRLRQAVRDFRASPTIPTHAFAGKMSKPQWEQFNCRHAELHFSFIVPA